MGAFLGIYMKYKFQYIGTPFSLDNPGTICEFEEWDLPEMRRQKQDWMELNAEENPEVNDKFFPKQRGRPAKMRPGVN